LKDRTLFAVTAIIVFASSIGGAAAVNMLTRPEPAAPAQTSCTVTTARTVRG